MATKQSDDSRLQSLPLVWRSRWMQIQPFLPVCDETWRTGRAPEAGAPEPALHGLGQRRDSPLASRSARLPG
jgi:hypothetical protein